MIPADAAEREPPDIAVIAVDNPGWSDLNHSGGKVHETPRVDRLSPQDMAFSHF